jgi:hypothetical protein
MMKNTIRFVVLALLFAPSVAWAQTGNVNVKQWGAGASPILGAMANYGTSPGAVKVPGVNAFVTNTVTEANSAAILAGITGAIPTQAPTVSIGGVGIVDSAGANVATVKAASTLPAATDTTLVVGLNPGTATAGTPTGAIVTVQGVSGGQPQPAILNAETTKVIGTVNQGTSPWVTNSTSTSQYPAGAVPITASATGTTGATTATLAGTVGKTTYICGYSIRANATAAATVTNTITGVITATMSSIMWVAPLASGIGVDEQIFSPCIPASATNTGIAIVSGTPGAGGNVSSKGWGYQL